MVAEREPPRLRAVDPPLNLRIPRDLVYKAELIATGKTKSRLRVMLMVTGPSEGAQP